MVAPTTSNPPSASGGSNNNLDVARRFMNMRENTNQRELDQFISSNWSGWRGMSVANTAWCSAFANGVLGACGTRGSNAATASSWLGWGQTVYQRSTGTGSIEQAQPGDIVVLNWSNPGVERSGAGMHVAFIAGPVTNGRVPILGGNQSDRDRQSGGMVSITNAPVRYIAQIRRGGGTGAGTGGNLDGISGDGSGGDGTGGSVDCNLDSGSPSFTGNEGTDTPAATAPGTPVPAAPGLRTNTNVDFQGGNLPPLPTSGNFNNMAANIKLSKYFTLAEFLHPALGAVAIPMGGKTVAGRHYTAQQLLQNMRDLCVLCLDPIKHRFPRMLITSTFRDKADASAHNVGWAADMQFAAHGFTGGQLLNVINTIAGLGIPYDQLLYEYPSGNNQTWVHIGLRRPSDLSVRKQAQSFYYGNYPNDSRKAMLGSPGTFVQFPGLRA
jgi:uncharacterized protein (TIGR02594 family)